MMRTLIVWRWTLFDEECCKVCSSPFDSFYQIVGPVDALSVHVAVLNLLSRMLNLPFSLPFENYWCMLVIVLNLLVGMLNCLLANSVCLLAYLLASSISLLADLVRLSCLLACSVFNWMYASSVCNWTFAEDASEASVICNTLLGSGERNGKSQFSLIIVFTCWVVSAKVSSWQAFCFAVFDLFAAVVVVDGNHGLGPSGSVVIPHDTRARDQSHSMGLVGGALGSFTMIRAWTQN